MPVTEMKPHSTSFLLGILAIDARQNREIKGAIRNLKQVSNGGIETGLVSRSTLGAKIGKIRANRKRRKAPMAYSFVFVGITEHHSRQKLWVRRSFLKVWEMCCQ